MGNELYGIAGLLIGVGLVALILNPRANTVPVINAGGNAFNTLLRTVTLQGGSQTYNSLSGGYGLGSVQ